MPAELSALLLMGIARGQGGTQMLLELLAVLHEKGLLSEPDIQRVVNVMADNMRDFDAQVQKSVRRADALKG
ncbi:hypothetical protein ACINK0_14975 [Deinococcus sp. VB343]|uniref:Uncharacterized protein n=1 Tax=Deinococcus sp. VB142 TaxID=3112952 RepID=A0AAU6Q7G1_9DEIO